MAVTTNQISLPPNSVPEGYLESEFRSMRYFYVAVIGNAKVDEIKRLQLIFQDARSSVFGRIEFNPR